jgi:transcription initiation factor TFIID TATA-box-binding protein
MKTTRPYEIHNVVATFNAGRRLNLKRIAQLARNVEYNPKRFAAVVMRFRDPKCTAMIFTSGKVVVNGARSEKDSKLGCKKTLRVLQRLSDIGLVERTLKEYGVCNIVAKDSLNQPIRLDGIAYNYEDWVTYEPEVFPAAIFRVVKPRGTVLIYSTGSLVFTGCESEELLRSLYDSVIPVLLPFCLPYVPPSSSSSSS